MCKLADPLLVEVTDFCTGWGNMHAVGLFFLFACCNHLENTAATGMQESVTSMKAHYKNICLKARKVLHIADAQSSSTLHPAFVVYVNIVSQLKKNIFSELHLPWMSVASLFKYCLSECVPLLERDICVAPFLSGFCVINPRKWQGHTTTLRKVTTVADVHNFSHRLICAINLLVYSSCFVLCSDALWFFALRRNFYQYKCNFVVRQRMPAGLYKVITYANIQVCSHLCLDVQTMKAQHPPVAHVSVEHSWSCLAWKVCGTKRVMACRLKLWLARATKPFLHERCVFQWGPAFVIKKQT